VCLTAPAGLFLLGEIMNGGRRQGSGRKPKPLAIHKLEGTYREDRQGTDHPAPDVCIPEMPSFLKGEAKKEWKRLSPLLAAKGCLTEWDRSLLAAYCFEYGEYIKLCESIEGCTSETDDETEDKKQNVIPLASCRIKILKNLTSIATEFGLSPSSRARVKVAGEVKEEDLYEQLRKRQLNAS
jgi:P27 family predicted phage terminase small subunit